MTIESLLLGHTRMAAYEKPVDTDRCVVERQEFLSRLAADLVAEPCRKCRAT